MITIQQLTKKFGNFTALDGLSLDIRSGCIYGIVGPNGSGKSTLLRLIAGVYRADGGQVLVDGEPAWENVAKKDQVFYLSDDLDFPPTCTVDELLNFYKGMYSGFSEELCAQLKAIFPLDTSKRLNTFSKGMRRQAALMAAFSCCPRYLLLDEAFDGLDPVIRLLVKKLMAQQIADRQMTVVITSHNLRELEDLCDHIGLLHKGSVLFEKEIDSLKLGLCKIQAVFTHPVDWQASGLDLLQVHQKGSMVSLLVRGDGEKALEIVQNFQPVFAEALPLTLEEIFIGEMEAVGYDYNNILQ